MRASKNFLPQSLLKEIFDYDPLDGRLIWKISYGRSRPGDAAGFHTGREKSPLYLCFGGIQYSIHVLIWIWMTGAPPNAEIDHENRNNNDNRWSNLRELTRAKNQENTGVYKTNKSGFRGVYWDNVSGHWKATLCIDGKNRHIGYFDRAEEAAEAWKVAALRVRGALRGQLTSSHLVANGGVVRDDGSEETGDR